MSRRRRRRRGKRYQERWNGIKTPSGIMDYGIPTTPTDPSKYKHKSESSRRKYFLWRKYPWCKWCGKFFATSDEATLDHIYPKRYGGTSRHTNIQLLCASCNQLKGGEITNKEDVENLITIARFNRALSKSRDLDRVIEEMLKKIK